MTAALPCQSNRQVDPEGRVVETPKPLFRNYPDRDGTERWRNRALTAPARAGGLVSWTLVERREWRRSLRYPRLCFPEPRPPCKYTTIYAYSCVVRSRAANTIDRCHKAWMVPTHLENGQTHLEHVLARRTKFARLYQMFQRRGEIASGTMVLSEIPMRHLWHRQRPSHRTHKRGSRAPVCSP